MGGLSRIIPDSKSISLLMGIAQTNINLSESAFGVTVVLLDYYPDVLNLPPRTWSLEKV